MRVCELVYALFAVHVHVHGALSRARALRREIRVLSMRADHEHQGPEGMLQFPKFVLDIVPNGNVRVPLCLQVGLGGVLRNTGPTSLLGQETLNVASDPPVYT